MTEFRVASEVARRYPSRSAGGQGIDELWMPAEKLGDFNAAIRGEIRVVAEFGCEGGGGGVG